MKSRMLLACVMLAVWIGCAKKAETPEDRGMGGKYRRQTDTRFQISAGVGDRAGRQRTVHGLFLAGGGGAVLRLYGERASTAARLIVSLEKMDTLKTLDESINRLKNDLSGSGFDISEVTAKSVQGMPGTQVHYSGFVDAKNKLEAFEVRGREGFHALHRQVRGVQQIFRGLPERCTTPPWPLSVSPCPPRT